jgi:hypothetical protein
MEGPSSFPRQSTTLINPEHIIHIMPKTPSPITKFDETSDGPNARGRWLGIGRLSRIPDAGWPSRSDCQKAVTPEERAAGEKLVAEYREKEQLASDNDVWAARNRIRNPECDTFEAERIREKIRGMSEEKYYGAQNRLSELRNEAAKLTRPVFERLVAEFDKELQAIALRREEELTAMGVPLYTDKEDARGHKYKDYTVSTDPLVTAWQCRRECVRHRSLNIDKDNAVACMQYLCH